MEGLAVRQVRGGSEGNSVDDPSSEGEAIQKSRKGLSWHESSA
ncbi:hypothetical protein D187_004681 [Cystobacter fuscus DSM 2262]|uniref:Uncharacterized protein n=1 Tax=Cystobacter fuscus (strain ATCC 25194 / DSM 2262 / NBRC 100088 / M29) TaxID=1242864 RepID=S9P6F0_CYSF2|nr:hypothetical protein D187_004681 [Cystobacter fuscus DSM 2262]